MHLQGAFAIFNGLVACPFYSPHLLGELAKEAFSTFWRLDLCQLLWNPAIFGQSLQHLEAAVAKLLVPSQQLDWGLFAAQFGSLIG